MSSEIRDINLAESGEQKIEWVRRNCDLLRMLEEEFSQSKPFAGKKVTLSVHLEAKTAYSVSYTHLDVYKRQYICRYQSLQLQPWWY